MSILSLPAMRFYGIDSFIDFIIFFVAMLIAYQSYNIYSLMRDKNYEYFSWAFLSISVAFLFKIIINFTFFNQIKILEANFISAVMVEHLELTSLINFFATIFYRIFFLAGFLILFLIFTKTEKLEKIVLFTYLSVITVFFSIYFNFVFHFTLFLLLLFLTAYFYRNHKKIKSRNSLLVFYSFLLIFIAIFIRFFSDLHPWFYLAYEIILFLGFLVLLINHLYLKNKN